MITSIDVSNNPGLAYLDINRCKSITSLNASGCPLTYVDLRNLAGTYSVLGYSGGAVDASKFSSHLPTALQLKEATSRRMVDG